MQIEGLDIDINKLPSEAKKEFLRYKIKLEEKRKESAIRDDFMSFVKYVWPDFVEGAHHKIMAEKFNFTKAYQRIEEINEWFQGEDIDLNKALAKYKEGMDLIGKCKKELETAKNNFEEVKKKYSVEEKDNTE